MKCNKFGDAGVEVNSMQRRDIMDRHFTWENVNQVKLY